MTNSKTTISLGFTDQEFSPGVHICQIFNDDNERQESALKFLLSGLQSGERTTCFSEKVTETDLQEFFENNGVNYEAEKKSGAFTLSGTREIYFQDGYFNPERMLDLLKNYYKHSIDNGYRAARVIGEMSPEIQRVPGGDRLLEYESKVSLLLKEYPVTAVCQYAAHDFDGATVMDILKVHPLMVVRGSVVHNPFYITPEEFLCQ
jgi:hypothetical protein